MSSISALFPSAQNQLLTIESMISNYESGNNRSADNETLLQYNINNLQRDLLQLDTLCNTEHSSRQIMWKNRINSLKDRLNLAQQTYTLNVNKHKRSYNDIRSDLLPGNRQRNNKYDNNSISSLQRESDSLNRVNKQIDDQLDMASYSYSSLVNQRDILKNTQRKALDIVNVLGLSGTVLKLAQRYERTNSYIVYTGMILTIVVMGATYYYFRYIPKHT